jgi:hypothetical protein
MALKINKALTTQDGGVLASGSHLIFGTRFPNRGLNYTVDIQIYRSLAALDSNLSPVRVSEIKNPFFTKTLTEQEFSVLTPVVIHNHVKEYVESLIGAGTTEIVL